VTHPPSCSDGLKRDPQTVASPDRLASEPHESPSCGKLAAPIDVAASKQQIDEILAGLPADVMDSCVEDVAEPAGQASVPVLVLLLPDGLDASDAKAVERARHQALEAIRRAAARGRAANRKPL
jgi:hypothetical protein